MRDGQVGALPHLLQQRRKAARVHLRVCRYRGNHASRRLRRAGLEKRRLAESLADLEHADRLPGSAERDQRIGEMPVPRIAHEDELEAEPASLQHIGRLFVDERERAGSLHHEYDDRKVHGTLGHALRSTAIGGGIGWRSRERCRYTCATSPSIRR